MISHQKFPPWLKGNQLLTLQTLQHHYTPLLVNILIIPFYIPMKRFVKPILSWFIQQLYAHPICAASHPNSHEILEWNRNFHATLNWDPDTLGSYNNVELFDICSLNRSGNRKILTQSCAVKPRSSDLNWFIQVCCISLLVLVRASMNAVSCRGLGNAHIINRKLVGYVT